MGRGWFHSWGMGHFYEVSYRGMLTPLFYEDVPLLPIPLFQMLPTPPPPHQLRCHSKPPLPSAVLSVAKFF